MSADFQYIDLSYLDLMSDGDSDMKATMLEMLLEEIPTEIKKMDVLCKTGDLRELREVSHKMKSTLAFVGNKEMTLANQTIEEISKSGVGTNQLDALVKTLLDVYPKALEELESIAATI